MTKQRAVILNVIRSDLHHPTAEEIFECAKLALPTISRATVYNNLHGMEEEGLIRRISGEGNSDRYDYNTMPHGHFFCTSCGEISDISLSGLEAQIASVSGAEIAEYELLVRGRCRKCLSNL